MCLLVLLHRVVPDRPVVLGANRDERYDRGSEPPSRRGGLLAPRDPRAGGTWVGRSDSGLDALLDRLAALLRRLDAGPFSGVVPCLLGPEIGTTSSALVATGDPPIFRFAAGPPCRTVYESFGP